MSPADEQAWRQTISNDFHLDARSIALVIRGLNSVYRLESESGPYYLKVYRAVGRTQAAIEHEHALLGGLNQMLEPGVAVAMPMRTSKGGSQAECLLAGQQRYYAIFRNAPGRQPNYDTADAAQVGRGVALLHRAMLAQHTPQASDRSPFTLISSSLDILRQVNELTTDFKRKVEAVGTRSMAEVSGQAHLKLAAIHGDICSLNCRIDGDLLTFFDFDECGLGSHLYDLAGWMFSAAASIEDERRLHSAAAACVQGYGETAGLEDAEILALPYFAMVHWLRTLAFLAANQLIPRDFWPMVEERHSATLSRITSLASNWPTSVLDDMPAPAPTEG